MILRHTRRLGTALSRAKAIVAMSGGVDSSVSAFLLKRQGMAVEGLYMHNWDSRDEDGTCPSERDWKDVQRACTHLEIPCRRVDLVKDYWTEVFDPMIQGYSRGWTPNPDVMCNRHIKFGRLLELLDKDLADGTTFLATGHYARLRRSEDGKTELLRAVDETKDQSYFLSSLSEKQLQNVVFPLGSLLKKDVKRIAVEEAKMPWLLERKESMGICMVGKRKSFGEFIGGYLEEARHSDDLRPVFVLGSDPSGSKPIRALNGARHNGFWHYTIGQAARIPGLARRHYVAHKVLDYDALVLVPSMEHEALMRRTLTIRDWRWVSEPPNSGSGIPFRISAQKGYHQEFLPATIITYPSRHHAGTMDAVVELDTPVLSAALGQWLVAYDGDKVLGGGMITELGPWEWPVATVEEVEEEVVRLLSSRDSNSSLAAMAA